MTLLRSENLTHRLKGAVPVTLVDLTDSRIGAGKFNILARPASSSLLDNLIGGF